MTKHNQENIENTQPNACHAELHPNHITTTVANICKYLGIIARSGSIFAFHGTGEIEIVLVCSACF
ncbi:hypothetical protein OROMI_033762 [Orobanche minor]